MNTMDVVVNVLRVQRLDWMIRFPGFDDPAQPRVFRRSRGGKLDDAVVADRHALLRQMAESNAAFHDDVAGVGCFAAEDQ
jgi:hypothetical protein